MWAPLYENQPTFTIFPLLQPNPDEKNIDISQIAELTLQTLGVNPPEDRALSWLALLGVYPKNPNMWESVKKNLYDSYWNFVKEFNLSDWENVDIPQSPKKSSFHVSNPDCMALIHIDLIRTSRQIFCLTPEISNNHNPNNVFSGFIPHIRRLERILYIFSLVNPTMDYHQGFNELIIPFYYVFEKARALFQQNMKMIEAITFSTFQNLICGTDLHEMYTTEDESSIILHNIQEFDKLLHKSLPKIALTLDHLKLNPSYYCSRWFYLLFAQEHDLFPLLLIWDSIFAHSQDLLNYIYCLGVSHLHNIEDKIDPAQFGSTMSSIQSLEIGNVSPIIKTANVLYQHYFNAN